MTKSSLLLLMIMIFTTSYGQDHQNIITGHVYDADSGLRLAAVNVYLSNTTLGDASDSLGIFQIKNIPPGNYDLVYHFVGYKQLVTNVNIGIKDTLIIDAGLQYTSYELDSLIVTHNRNRLWERNLNRFIRHFIGRSSNAEQTSIMNSELLDFNIEKMGIYSAKAQRELHIVNKALGYESFVHLEHFKWNYFEDSGQAFYYVRMKELDAENNEQRENWKIRRSVTYDNSMQMFLKGLLHTIKHRPEKEKNGPISITEVIFNKRYKILNGEIRPIHNTNEIARYLPSGDKYEVWGFKVNKYIEKDPLTIIPDGGATSYLDYYDQDSKEFFVVVGENGNLLNPLDVAIGGYWAKLRFADFLPFNYRTCIN